jgi:metal-responsive CopG/Arc/MetJ family transcriptional regulator
LKLVRSTPPDVHVAFRLANSMLNTVDVLCDKLDVTRSQFIRKSIKERIKALKPDDVTPPANHMASVTVASSETKRNWSPELYDRLQRRR